jgi:UDP-N-acetylglucosamine acyltransferase
MDGDNRIEEGAIIGGRPQHLQAGSNVGAVRVGSGNIIREHSTIHCALEEGNETVLGDHNLLMVNVHVAHDCQIGSHAILVNNVMLGGHVEVNDRAYLSGGVGVHQFCRIGQFAMVRGLGRVTQDVPPYVTFDGLTRDVVGLNVVGLRRNGFTSDDLKELKSAYRLIFRSGLPWSTVLETLTAQFPEGPANAFGRFFAAGNRGFVQSRSPLRRPIMPLVSPGSEDETDLPRPLGKAA